MDDNTEDTFERLVRIIAERKEQTKNVYTNIFKPKKVKIDKDVERMVQLSLRWGMIEDNLEALEWKNSIKAVENNLIKGI
tara:strand:+ start:375 stop:614 length:240 start_codon:yes stop_codon:yes gene_type:complete